MDKVFVMVYSISHGPSELVYSTVLAIFAALWIGFLCFGQIELVAAETTTFEVLRGHHDGNTRRCRPAYISNVAHFLWTGNYRVVRPDRCKLPVQVFSNFQDAFATLREQGRPDNA
jgi:hypothetical protein